MVLQEEREELQAVQSGGGGGDQPYETQMGRSEEVSGDEASSRKEMLTAPRYESSPINIDNRRWDPVTATASSLAATGTGMVTSAADIVVKPIQAFSRQSSSKSGAKSDVTSDTASARSDDTF